MIYKIYLLFITALIVGGCSTSDLQNNIDKVLDKEKEQISTIDKASDEKDGLDSHNDVRAKVYNGSILSWSDEIAADAQSHANTLAISGKLEHDPRNRNNGYENGPYGENLYATTDNNIAFRDAVKSWSTEKDYYTHIDNSCSISESNIATVGDVIYNTCGHYTQIVWRDTEYVGCAKAKYQTGEYKGGYVIVCKYKSPGNVVQDKVQLSPY